MIRQLKVSYTYFLFYSSGFTVVFFFLSVAGVQVPSYLSADAREFIRNYITVLGYVPSTPLQHDRPVRFIQSRFPRPIDPWSFEEFRIDCLHPHGASDDDSEHFHQYVWIVRQPTSIPNHYLYCALRASCALSQLVTRFGDADLEFASGGKAELCGRLIAPRTLLVYAARAYDSSTVHLFN